MGLSLGKIYACEKCGPSPITAFSLATRHREISFVTDMLVNLYSERRSDRREVLSAERVAFQRALSIDRKTIVNFIDSEFGEVAPGWQDECIASLYRQPTGCFIAIEDKSVVGFACYDSTAKGMVGPLGVRASHRSRGIASVLLNLCFEAMQMEGYAYAIIGWVNSTEFYEKSCGAMKIPDSFPGVYSRMVEN